LISEFRSLSAPHCVIACLAVIAALFAGFLFDVGELRDAWRLVGVAVAVMTLIWHDELKFGNASLTPIVLGALAGFIVGGDLQAAYAAWWNHSFMREYDFFALYMDANIAWNRLDFYEPANYQAAYERIAPPFAELHPGFQRNVLETGTKYPPPTLLYLAPFGALDRLDAHVAWIIVCWLMMAGCVWMLWRHVAEDRTLLSLLAVTALILVHPGTKLTLSLEQMHFTALFLLLLAWIFRHQPLSGLWIALGTIIKPPVGAVALYLLRIRNWSGIAVLAASTIALCGASIAAFGLDVFIRFFTDNPNLRVSNSLYFEDMNRSTLGTVIRTFGWDFDQGSPMGHPFFLTAIGVFTAITAIAVWLCQNWRDARVFALLICFTLLVYPGTQRHYAVLMILPLMLFIAAADRSGWSKWLSTIVAVGVAVFGVSHTLWSIVVLWLALIALIVTDAGDDPQTDA